jgi:hypothetical protein
MGGAPVNYRDDLEKKIRETLTDGFEILSITFHDEKVEPRGYGRPEWRETPIAYLLIKAKDGRVDRIPAIPLDLDFLDKRGKVVLPVESPVLLIDARADKPPARPLDKLNVTEILDERELKDGKLTLEVKATGRGIIPELNELLEVAPAGFQVEKVTDHGLTVTKLDAESDSLAAICERNWLVALAQAPGADAPTEFRFPKPKLDTAELTYKRYADADLVEVKESLALAGLPLQPASYRGWMLSGVMFAICGVALFFLLRTKQGPVAEEAALYALPAHVTPFTVLNLLRRMEQDARLSLPPDRRSELAQTIRDMEQRFFGRGPETNGHSELERLAREWVSRARS